MVNLMTIFLIAMTIIASNKNEYSLYYDHDQYEICIEHLQKYEGFRSKVYLDTDGSPTIGYGHHLSKNENYNNISESFGASLLKKDFNKRIKFVYDNYKLTRGELLAVSLLAYNTGTGNVQKQIRSGLLDNYERSIKYCRYYSKKYKKWITSERLRERRKFEITLFYEHRNNELDTIAG